MRFIPDVSRTASLQIIHIILIHLLLDLLRQKVARQRLPRRDPLLRIQLQTNLEEIDALHDLRVNLLPLIRPRARDGPLHDLLQQKPFFPDAGQRALEHGAVQLRASLHALLPEDGGDLDDRVDIVRRVEKGEALAQDGEEDDAGGPDVDFGRLSGAFEENFGGAKTSCAGSVGPARGPLVVFGIAGWG